MSGLLATAAGGWRDARRDLCRGLCAVAGPFRRSRRPAARGRGGFGPGGAERVGRCGGGSGHEQRGDWRGQGHAELHRVCHLRGRGSARGYRVAGLPGPAYRDGPPPAFVRIDSASGPGGPAARGPRPPLHLDHLDRPAAWPGLRVGAPGPSGNHRALAGAGASFRNAIEPGPARSWRHVREARAGALNPPGPAGRARREATVGTARSCRARRSGRY